MTRPKPKSVSRQLEEAKDRISQLEVLLNRRRTGWKTVDGLIKHLDELAFAASPEKGRNLESITRGGEPPVFPGVSLSDRPGSRRLHHSGSKHQGELDRLLRRVDGAVNESRNHMLGLDFPADAPPPRRAPRAVCRTCGNQVVPLWKRCPWCPEKNLQNL